MWSLLEHTADLRVAVEASSWEELLCEAARAFAALVTGAREGELRPPPGAPLEERLVELSGADAHETWVRWWRALHRAWTVEGLLPVRVLVAPDAAPGCTTATLACLPAARLDVGAGEDVKAVTWHGALVTVGPGGRWRGEVVLDV